MHPCRDAVLQGGDQEQLAPLLSHPHIARLRARISTLTQPSPQTAQRGGLSSLRTVWAYRGAPGEGGGGGLGEGNSRVAGEGSAGGSLGRSGGGSQGEGRVGDGQGDEWEAKGRALALQGGRQ